MIKIKLEIIQRGFALVTESNKIRNVKPLLFLSPHAKVRKIISWEYAPTTKNTREVALAQGF